jgi:hypothetical protein
MSFDMCLEGLQRKQIERMALLQSFLGLLSEYLATIDRPKRYQFRQRDESRKIILHNDFRRLSLTCCYFSELTLDRQDSFVGLGGKPNI